MKTRLLALTAMLALATTGCTSTPSVGQPGPAASTTVDYKAELSAFIAKRGADQGKAAGAMMMTSAIKSVTVTGTEWVIVAEFESLLIAADVQKQVAYMVGVYDPTVTKVTIKTPGGQELFAGAPPKQPITASPDA
ncbi:hypothetical protein QEZ54_28965 [Catellatospora sp. KI3]|uniref:hypothetical protein n=1 Tax=Catellatospora sp. KI3 TaxID=3041620 RepID=UPI002482AF33|nr:hypothetical protein [Catellatospora sp. KI3]MDI1465008.1 hypothetical protein [Catellatospora sp. KI3]